jgi:stage V sporulation protein SpoVS
MNNRLVLALSCTVCLLIAPGTRAATSAAAATATSALDVLSTKDASARLKAALSQSVNKAVKQLGATDGFLSNPKVTIPLPSAFRDVEPALRLLGRGGDADELKASLNHAAEAAVSEAAPVLKKSLRNMTLADAKGILSGGEDSATQFFRHSAGDELRSTFRPIVARATAKVKLAELYDKLADQVAQYGLLGGNETNMNDYVTDKALDGLFIVMADEERAIRKDPLGQASAIIRKVFGAQ